MKIKAVIFDHDGVIVESVNTWKVLRKEKKKDISKLVSKKLLKNIENSYEIYKLAESKGLMTFTDFRYIEVSLLTMLNLSVKDFEIIAKKLKFRPYIKELVKELYENDITLGICSLAPKPCIDVTIKKLGYPFKYVFGTNMIFLNGKYLDSFVYPTENHNDPISFIEGELDKASCINCIRKKENLRKDEIIYVSDGDDPKIADHCLIIAYNSSNKEWVKKACLVTNDHRDILDFILKS